MDKFQAGNFELFIGRKTVATTSRTAVYEQTKTINECS